MRRHYWKYLTNQNGEPIANARIHLFKNGTVTESEITNSSISEDNIFEDIADSSYAYLTNNKNESINNFNYSSIIEIYTNEDGFFEFWIADKEESNKNYGYDYNQEFVIAWYKSNISPNIIDNIQIFGTHLEVDETDNESNNKTNKNKLISNEQAYNWNQHISDISLDEHTQYIHSSKNRIVTAIHTFSPSTAGVPFILGSNAINQKITGLNADKLDGYDASHFATTDIATLTSNGLMSSDDKLKLDNINLTDYLVNSNNLSDISSSTVARTNLGLKINTDVQAYNSNLQSISNISPTSNTFLVGNGSNYSKKTDSEIKEILNLGSAAYTETNEYVQKSTSVPVSSGAEQDIFSSLNLKDDLDNITLELNAAQGSIGLFNKSAPTTQEIINNLSTFSEITSGSETVDLNSLNIELESLHNKINEILTALKSFGIVGE